MRGAQGAQPDPMTGDTGGGTGDPLVDDLAGEGYEPAGSEGEAGDSEPNNNQPPDLSDLDPDTATVRQLLERMQLTNDFASKTASNLEKERAKRKALEKELAKRQGREPEEDEDERIRYQPEAVGDDYDFYDEDAMIAFMAKNDPNFEQMKGDDVYMGQNRAFFGALMNALGRMGMENAAMQRQFKMQQYGVNQQEIESFLNIPEFSHLSGMPIDHIIDVMRGIRKFAGGQEPPKPEGGIPPTPPGGARQSVRRDQRHYQENRRSIGTGSLSPEDEIHKALDAGDREAGRNIARELFYSMGRKQPWDAQR